MDMPRVIKRPSVQTEQPSFGTMDIMGPQMNSRCNAVDCGATARQVVAAQKQTAVAKSTCLAHDTFGYYKLLLAMK